MTPIEGPFSFKDVDGLKTPVYFFLPGGERKEIGAVTVKVEGGMTFEVALAEQYKDVDQAAFDVPMRYTYLRRSKKAEINWGYNCLTTGIHHGRPEAIWNMPLTTAIVAIPAADLEELVVMRIYNDAMQLVHHGINPSSDDWARGVRDHARSIFAHRLQVKVGEIYNFYTNSMWRNDMHDAVKLSSENKLNPHFNPLHPHDSINLLCRIIGSSAMNAME